MSHEDVPAPFELPEHPEVEVISSIASSAGAHLSNALEQLWLATAAGTCSPGSTAGVDVHRRAVASVAASWFAMESAVNKTLYFKLRHRESPYFLAPGDRKQMDRQISDGLGGQLGFEERLTYLAEDKECCSLVEDHRGKLRQFEKLRNSLVHGYVYRREALAESDPSTTKVSTNDDGNTIMMTTFSVEHEELQDFDGNTLELAKRFSELGLRHDETRLCSHDAARCLYLCLDVLCWLDTHYGVSTNCTWPHRGSRLGWSSRSQPGVPGAPQRLVGAHAVHVAWSELDESSKKRNKFDSVIDAKKRRGQRGTRRNSRRR